MIAVATDIRIRKANGRYYAASQVLEIFRRYAAAFGKLTFLCRRYTEDCRVNAVCDITDLVDDVLEIPSFSTLLRGKDNARIRSVVQRADLLICRCPTLIGTTAARYAQKFHIPVFAEAMGGAWAGYWNHGVLGKFLAPYGFFGMRSVLSHADYALYVTNQYLQKHYPCRCESVAASNVKISAVSPNKLAERLKRTETADYSVCTLVTTAAVDVPYKGQEYVIRAIPMLNKAGIRVRYLLIGGGDNTHLTAVAAQCGVTEQVEFLGRKTLEEVFLILDTADLYIQPSMQEGLPRSVIEAMSRGLPALGAHTAGIPELIAPSCVFRKKSASAIAHAVLQNYQPEVLSALAKENFERAKDYEETRLSDRRNAYFQKVLREISEK